MPMVNRAGRQGEQDPALPRAAKAPGLTSASSVEVTEHSEREPPLVELCAAPSRQITRWSP